MKSSLVSAARTLDLELAVLIAIQNLCWGGWGGGGGADDRFVTLVVKMVYGKISLRSWPISANFLQTSCCTAFS